ncbi:MAG: alpha/beta hydrolase [Lachnospiraceae bacterium]|nr:alpha/beta hydrolase [Lachnospiraceae bacterium]
MSFFIYRNKEIFYDEIGEGKPILLLHGNTASSNMFLDAIKLYSPEYKVILLDFLGHGKSQRVKKFDDDLWFDEAEQVIAFLKHRKYEKVNLIGSSGGALVAINVALESPNLVDKIVADSFEGEFPLKDFIQNIIEERELSKQNENTKMFYSLMHGEDWENVVDNDTNSINEHSLTIGKFFHKPLESLQPDILMTGSKKDEFISSLDADYFQKKYGEMIKKIGHGKMHLFESGGHPAMLSNQYEFAKLSKDFFEENLK